jgi:putative transposase
MALVPPFLHQRLPRLPIDHYRGRTWAHWTMTIDRRATGWLDTLLHARMREWLCHSLARYQGICPVYCLMPDHAHFLWIGGCESSDQRKAAALLRRTWNLELRARGWNLQRQAYDHVLREAERKRDAFIATAEYVLENPVRAGLVPHWREYPFLGALVPGYPVLDPRTEDFWPVFWRIFARSSGNEEPAGCGETLTRSATPPPQRNA